MAAPGNMTFRRFGRSYHLHIATAEDLRSVVELDEAHWVATGAPIDTINCDRTFLELLDTDRNGRILCFEIKDAIAWGLMNLARTDGVDAGSTALRLDAINTDREEGTRIAAAAQKTLARLGLPDDEEITLEQVRKVKAEEEATPVSGAGVVLPEAAADPQVRQFIADIVATVGGEPHPSGSAGAGQGRMDEFLAEARGYLAWRAQAELPAAEATSEIMPLGADTPAAFALLASVGEKLDQYFAQCEAVTLDAAMAVHMGPRAAELEGLDLGDPAAVKDLLRKAPLARARAEGVLDFAEKINPYYAGTLAELRTQVIEPVLGGASPTLSVRQWQEVKAAFAAHQAWADAKAGAAVEPLGAEKLTAYLDERFSRAVAALLSESAANAIVLDNIRLTEKLILYQAYLCELANNFVSFPHLYDATRRAMFELGTLVMDGRRFSLSVKVDNRAAHAAVAKNSNMYVLYCQIAPKQGGDAYEVAVPVTSGGKGNLCVGKRGIFEDIYENECDARVVQVIENPISVAEALVSPFQRIGRLVTGKIESITTQAEKTFDAQTKTVISGPEKAPPPAAQPGGRPSGMMAGGLLMGGGVAVAAVGSSIAYMTKTLAALQWWQILIGVASAVFAVLLPISIVAMVKLRRRDLSGILEGSGWAINARMRLTHRLARFFTQRPAYPRQAKGIRRLRRWIVLAVIIALAAAGITAYLKMRHRPKKSTPPPATSPAGPQAGKGA